MKNRVKYRYVDTGIVQRGKGYTFTVALGMDSNRKQIRKTATFHPPEGISRNKADRLAREEYINFKNQCKGTGFLKDNMTFSALCEEYFKIYAPNRLKPVSQYVYQHITERHFSEYFGSRKLRDISTGLLSGYFCVHLKGKPSSVRQNFMVMRSIMAYAVSQRYLAANPCQGVILPGRRQEEEERRKSLTTEQLDDFLRLFEGYSRLNTIVRLLLFTGMRSGEARGLLWDDIDLSANRIYIHHTLSRINGEYVLSSPKTRKSKRFLCMNPATRELLLEHRQNQELLQKECILQGKEFLRPEAVFTTAEGEYVGSAMLWHEFKKKLRGTEFEYMTIHFLRHTNATLLINEGVDLKIVSEHLGHAAIGTTADIYADILDESKQRTAQIIQEKLCRNI